MGDKDCTGTLHTLELAAGVYESDVWYPDGNKNAKADSIESLMKKLGIDKKQLCKNDCTDKTKDCRSLSLHANAEDEGGQKEENKPEKADLGIAHTKLFDTDYHKYVLWVKKKCNVLLKVSCDCIGKNE